MKKRMLALGALMAGVALTSYSVSGTYAKYTSKVGTATDTATVAKWFKTGSETLTLSVFDSATFVGKKTVKSADLVAPGTYGVVELDFTGSMLTQIKEKLETPEVAYTLVPSITVTDGTSGKIHFWIDDQSTASNVEGREVYYQGEGTGKDLDRLKSAIAEATTVKVDAEGTAKAVTENKYLHWAWKYDGSDDPGDTALGAAAGADSPASVTLSMDLTATQISPDDSTLVG